MAALLLACLPGMAGCSQAPSHGKDLTAGGAQALEVAPGVTVSSATYTLSGPDGFTSAGTVPVGDSPDLSISPSGLPVGTGYEISVFALASDDVTTCEASATFDVTGPTITVPVHLACGVPTGDVNVTATFDICPVMDGLDALPAEARLGGRSALLAIAHDTDLGPSPLTYRWRIHGAPLNNHPQPTLTFTCTNVGSVAIQATVSDGNPDVNCADSLTATVTCSP